MILDANIAQNVTPAVFFEQHILQHAVQYFPGLHTQEVNVRLVNGRQYRHSQFYRFEISGGGKSFHALVKTPPLHSPYKDRPKLGPRIEPSDKFEAQYKAMSKIHEYFTGLADPRFGTVRNLDKLTEHRAIIMEEVPDPSLRRLVKQTSRLKNPLRAGGPSNLALAFRNAGSWLCKFHSMPTFQPVKVTHNGQRLDFITTINKLVDFLINADPRNLFLQQIAAKTVQDAMQILPEELPLGLRHGDYGLSNILAGLGGKITVLDTPAICHSPIYEDLAYLLVGLKAKWIQVFSLKLAYDSNQFALYEREFLSGYFGRSPIPYRIIRLYEVQALLVRWSSKIFVLKEQSASKNGFSKGLQLWMMRRFFKTMLRDLAS
jgi:Phosphotransferase enzyme family